MSTMSLLPGVGSYVPARRMQALQSASAAEQRADALQRESERLRAEAATTEQRAVALDRAAEQSQARAQQARQAAMAAPATASVGRPQSADPASALSTVQWAEAARRAGADAPPATANPPARTETAPTSPGVSASPGVPRLVSAVALGLSLPSPADFSPSPVPGALVSIRA